MTRRVFLLPLIVLASLTVVFAACNDDDDGGSEEDIAAIEETITSVFGTDPNDPEQVEYAMAHFTDEIMENFFGMTKEECAAAAEDCLGDPTVIERFEGTTASGGEGGTTVFDEEESVYAIDVVEEKSEWLVSDIRFGPQELPEGVTAVDIQLAEYNFVFDESEITDGNVGFPFENIGEEPHEIVTLKVNEEFDPDAAIDFFAAQENPGEELPPGVEAISFLGFAPPGARGIGYAGEPFEPGDYAFGCMIPDPEGTPHASNGMLSEFTVTE